MISVGPVPAQAPVSSAEAAIALAAGRQDALGAARSDSGRSTVIQLHAAVVHAPELASPSPSPRATTVASGLRVEEAADLVVERAHAQALPGARSHRRRSAPRTGSRAARPARAPSGRPARPACAASDAVIERPERGLRDAGQRQRCMGDVDHGAVRVLDEEAADAPRLVGERVDDLEAARRRPRRAGRRRPRPRLMTCASEIPRSWPGLCWSATRDLRRAVARRGEHREARLVHRDVEAEEAGVEVARVLRGRRRAGSGSRGGSSLRARRSCRRRR